MFEIETVSLFQEDAYFFFQPPHFEIEYQHKMIIKNPILCHIGLKEIRKILFGIVIS